MSGGEALAGALEAVETGGYAVGPVSIRIDERGKKRPTFHTSWESDPDGITRDPEQVVEWARRYPGCGFHAPTGPNGLVVVDLDVTETEDGRRSWRVAHGPTSPMTVTTQSGGEQLYFRAPEEPIRNSSKAIPGVPAVDVRGDGGTVFISGTHVRGGGYYSANRIVPAAELPKLPEQWADRLRSAGPAGTTRTRERSSAPRSSLVSASALKDRTWVEAKVDDELRELVRHGQANFRQRLGGTAAIVYRAVGCGAIGEEDAEQRLADAIVRVWGAEPDGHDLQWVADGRRLADEDPWHLLLDEPAVPEPATPELEDDQAEAVLEWERKVRHELETLEVREEARRRLRSAHRAPMPPITALDAFLAVEDEPVPYRIGELLPVGGRVMLAAAFKAGKSTLMGNLLRALVDGGNFLGRFKTEPIEGRVVLIDDELDERMLRRWLRDHGIRNVDRVSVVSMRGRVSSFDVTDRATRAQWAARLREAGAEFVILDCLRPVLDALGLDEHTEAGKFLVPFDELLAEAGVGEAVVVHHTGHGGERSRGDSRLRDWPDVEWHMKRQDPEDPRSKRYFSAIGRDVDVPECELGHDPHTRALTIVGGSRKDAAVTAAGEAILALLGKEQGRSGRQIEDALLAVHGRRPIRDAIKNLITTDAVVVRAGPKNAVLHYLADGATHV